MRRQVLRGGLAVLAIAVTGLAWAVDAPPASAEPECMTGSNDFNLDGIVDAAVGMPGAAGGRGAVEVRVSDGDGTAIHRLTPPQGASGDRFGTALAEVASYEGSEIDRGTCSRLVVGAPGRDVGALNDAGAIFVYDWDADEGEFTLFHEFRQGAQAVPGQPQAGAGFGSDLASPFHEPDIVGSVVRPLYVGVPGYDLAGRAGAGAVAELVLGSSQVPIVEEGQLVTQNVAGVPGAAEDGDRFGAALAVSGTDVFIGVPGENNSSGGVLDWDPSPGATERFVTQNAAGVPGTPEAGDNFGATIYSATETSLAGGGHNVLVGAPGEAIGSARGAGSVIVFWFDGDFALSQTKGFNQNTAGVAGVAEAGDAFGSSIGTWGAADFLVGVPGEDIGTLRDAGSVSALRSERAWTQDTTGVPGGVEAGDRFGQTIGNVRVPFTGDEDDVWLDAPLIGVPGENAGAGTVLSGLPGRGVTPVNWVADPPAAGDRYGQALGSAN